MYYNSFFKNYLNNFIIEIRVRRIWFLDLKYENEDLGF